MRTKMFHLAVFRRCQRLNVHKMNAERMADSLLLRIKWKFGNNEDVQQMYEQQIQLNAFM